MPASYSFRRSLEANPKLATAEGRNVTWDKQQETACQVDALQVKWMLGTHGT